MSGSVVTTRIPVARHRHAAPSGPWPFLDIDDEVDASRIEDPDSHLPLSAAACDHKQTPTQEVCWCKYPQSLYPNWTIRQQKKSRIRNMISERSKENCTIRYLDVTKAGMFINAGNKDVNPRTVDKHWNTIQGGRPPGVRVRALFVEGLSGTVLQILGTRYNIEPFFFSSTIGWIPSRHQTNVVANVSDHITITLPFIRSIANPKQENVAQQAAQGDIVIDTRAPLALRSSSRLLMADQLAVHMVRSPTSNTIISLHPNHEHPTTTAETLHTRVHATGRSVYWSNIFRDTRDPTFVFLSLLWYALYAWDEALEHLYNHICSLESEVIHDTDMSLTRELHVIRAHLLHYESLLRDFTKSVEFVHMTPNPSFTTKCENEEEEQRRQRRAVSMDRECGNLLIEIERLEGSRNMQDKRLKNVMDLGFSMVNIEDSRRTQKLTEAAFRDSAAIKQISYLTMAFIPASFVAAVFGMNVSEINPQGYVTLAQYVAVAIPLTAVTIWIIVAYQIQIKDPRAELLAESRSKELGVVDDAEPEFYLGLPQRRDATVGFKRLDLWSRIWWPAILLSTMVERRRRRSERQAPQTRVRTD